MDDFPILLRILFADARVEVQGIIEPALFRADIGEAAHGLGAIVSLVGISVQEALVTGGRLFEQLLSDKSRRVSGGEMVLGDGLVEERFGRCGAVWFGSCCAAGEEENGGDEE